MIDAFKIKSWAFRNWPDLVAIPLVIVMLYLVFWL